METVDALYFLHPVSSAFGLCPDFKLAETFGTSRPYPEERLKKKGPFPFPFCILVKFDL